MLLLIENWDEWEGQGQNGEGKIFTIYRVRM